MTESQILDVARQLHAAVRDEFLRIVCGSDRLLLERIERQLQAESKATEVEDSRTVLMLPKPLKPSGNVDQAPDEADDDLTGRTDADDHFSLRQSEANQTRISDQDMVAPPKIMSENLIVGQRIGS